MKMQPSLVALVAAISLPAMNVPTKALAFGHGEAPSLAHFVKISQTVHVSLVANRDVPARYLARFAAAGDRSVIVTSQAPARALARAVHERKPGWLLAGFEGHSSISNASFFASAGATRILTAADVTVVSVDARGFALLSANPRAFVDAVGTQEIARPQTVALGARAESARRTTRVSDLVTLEPDEGKMLATVRELSGEDDIIVDGRGTRIVDRGNDAPRVLAQKYMVDRFRALGLEAGTKCYTQGFRKGCNVEATLWGSDRSEVVVFSAHLDSVRNKGADDDGSGSAALLEVARLYANLSPKKSIRFLAFDQEELGLIGSKAYAADLSQGSGRPKIAGVFQMDMIAYDSDGDASIHAMDCDRPESAPLTRALADANTRLGTRLKIVKACTNRSDHASFWNKGIAATLVSENFFGGDGTREDSNRCYHQACDTVQLVNMPYMTKIVKIVANAGWAFQDGLR